MAGELTRLMASGQVRASDAERDRAIETLRHHYAAGRLSSDELEERIGRACAARTRGELAAVQRDLPSDRRRRAAQRMERANRAALRAHATSYAGVNGGLVAIWGATGAGEFWPIWPILGWGFGLAWHWAASRSFRRRLVGRTKRPGRRYA